MKRLSSITMAIAIFFMVQASTELKGMKDKKSKKTSSMNTVNDQRFIEKPEVSPRFEKKPEKSPRFIKEPKEEKFPTLNSLKSQNEGNYIQHLEDGTVIITAVNLELNKEQIKILRNFAEQRPEPVLKPEQKFKPFFRSKPTRQPVLNKDIWGIVEYTESEKQKHAWLLLQFKDKNN